MSKPKVVFILGVNGAGKSTIRDNLLFRETDFTVIDPDKVSKKIQNEKNISQDAADPQAARIVIEQIKESIANKKNLIIESTLSGKTIFNRFDLAIKNDYSITSLYVALDSLELHKDRVANRVQKGGHYISDSVIENRFNNRNDNIVKAMEKSDSFVVYDNSLEELKVAMIYRKDLGEVNVYSQKNWVNEILEKLPNDIKVNLSPYYPEDIHLSKIFREISYDLNDNQKQILDRFEESVFERFKDNPDSFINRLEQINEKLPDIVSGKIELPDLPKIEKDKDIDR